MANEIKEFIDPTRTFSTVTDATALVTYLQPSLLTSGTGNSIKFHSATPADAPGSANNVDQILQDDDYNISWANGFTIEAAVVITELNVSSSGAGSVGMVLDVQDPFSDNSLFFMQFDNLHSDGVGDLYPNMTVYNRDIADDIINSQSNYYDNLISFARGTTPLVIGQNYHTICTFRPSNNTIAIWINSELVGEWTVPATFFTSGGSLLDGTNPTTIVMGSNLLDGKGGESDLDNIKIHLLEADQSFVDDQFQDIDAPAPDPDNDGFGGGGGGGGGGSTSYRWSVMVNNAVDYFWLDEGIGGQYIATNRGKGFIGKIGPNEYEKNNLAYTTFSLVVPGFVEAPSASGLGSSKDINDNVNTLIFSTIKNSTYVFSYGEDWSLEFPMRMNDVASLGDVVMCFWDENGAGDGIERLFRIRVSDSDVDILILELYTTDDDVSYTLRTETIIPSLLVYGIDWFYVSIVFESLTTLSVKIENVTAIEVDISLWESRLSRAYSTARFRVGHDQDPADPSIVFDGAVDEISTYLTPLADANRTTSYNYWKYGRSTAPCIGQGSGVAAVLTPFFTGFNDLSTPDAVFQCGPSYLAYQYDPAFITANLSNSAVQVNLLLGGALSTITITLWKESLGVGFPTQIDQFMGNETAPASGTADFTLLTAGDTAFAVVQNTGGVDQNVQITTSAATVCTGFSTEALALASPQPFFNEASSLVNLCAGQWIAWTTLDILQDARYRISLIDGSEVDLTIRDGAPGTDIIYTQNDCALTDDFNHLQFVAPVNPTYGSPIFVLAQNTKIIDQDVRVRQTEILIADPILDGYPTIARSLECRYYKSLGDFFEKLETETHSNYYLAYQIQPSAAVNGNTVIGIVHGSSVNVDIEQWQSATPGGTPVFDHVIAVNLAANANWSTGSLSGLDVGGGDVFVIIRNVSGGDGITGLNAP